MELNRIIDNAWLYKKRLCHTLTDTLNAIIEYARENNTLFLDGIRYLDRFEADDENFRLNIHYKFIDNEDSKPSTLSTKQKEQLRDLMGNAVEFMSDYPIETRVPHDLREKYIIMDIGTDLADKNYIGYELIDKY